MEVVLTVVPSAFIDSEVKRLGLWLGWVRGGLDLHVSTAAHFKSYTCTDDLWQVGRVAVVSRAVR